MRLKPEERRRVARARARTAANSDVVTTLGSANRSTGRQRTILWEKDGGFSWTREPGARPVLKVREPGIASRLALVKRGNPR